MKLQTEIVGNEPYEFIPLGDHVVRAVGVCGGRPTFKYTRIEVTGTLSRLSAGETLEAIVAGYQGRVSREAVQEAIDLAIQSFAEHSSVNSSELVSQS